MREVLERAQRVLGPLHPDTLSALTNLAEVLKNRGQYAEAETLLREALDGTRKTSGENHVDTLYVMNNLAQCLQVQNKREEAKRALSRMPCPAASARSARKIPTRSP